MPSSSGWTIETLHEHLMALMGEMDKRNGQRFAAQEEALKTALASAKEAVGKAEAASEKRFENTNEWRQTVNDTQALYIPRKEVEAGLKSMDEKIGTILSRLNMSQGFTGGIAKSWATLVGLAAFVAAIIAIVMNLRHG